MGAIYAQGAPSVGLGARSFLDERVKKRKRTGQARREGIDAETKHGTDALPETPEYLRCNGYATARLPP